MQSYWKPVWVATVVSRQEPGKNFALKVPGPQFHAVIAPLATTGINTIVPFASALIPCAVTWIAPIVLVLTLATYLDVEVEDSQPQFPAVGNEAALLV